MQRRKKAASRKQRAHLWTGRVRSTIKAQPGFVRDVHVGNPRAAARTVPVDSPGRGEPRGRGRGFVLRRGGSLLCPRLARGFVRIRSPLARAGLVVAHEQTRRFLTFQSWVPWAGAGPAAALCGGTAARRPRAQSAARTPAAPRLRRRSGNIPRGAAAASLTRSPCSSAVRAPQR